MDPQLIPISLSCSTAGGPWCRI